MSDIESDVRKAIKQIESQPLLRPPAPHHPNCKAITTHDIRYCNCGARFF